MTLFVGGILYSVVDQFVEQAFDLDTPWGKQRRTVADLRKENDDLRTENRKLQGQLKKVGKAANRSRTRLLRSASRSVATVPAKALPYAGAFVVAGLTAVEIKELCETMRDMDRIKRMIDDPDAEAESEPAVCPVPVPSRQQLLERIEGSAQRAWVESKKYVPDLPDWDDVPNSWREALQDTVPAILRDTWERLKRLFP